MNVFFCAKKMLLRCNFFDKGHATMAANESIVDPLVFLRHFLFFPVYGREVF